MSFNKREYAAMKTALEFVILCSKGWFTRTTQAEATCEPGRRKHKRKHKKKERVPFSYAYVCA